MSQVRIWLDSHESHFLFLQSHGKHISGLLQNPVSRAGQANVDGGLEDISRFHHEKMFTISSYGKKKSSPPPIVT